MEVKTFVTIELKTFVTAFDFNFQVQSSSNVAGTG